MIGSGETFGVRQQGQLHVLSDTRGILLVLVCNIGGVSAITAVDEYWKWYGSRQDNVGGQK